MNRLPYRLALDLGSTSLGWALIRLNKDPEPRPVAIIKAGVRIFSDGRNPKDGSSLAVTRREARAMRRRRDRLLKRKNRMKGKLIEFGFFPQDDVERKALEKLNPYALRAKGLDEALTPAEFARALFHINQRRGFKSNRKTDKSEADSGALKMAIKGVSQALIDTHSRTVGEWLYKRQHNQAVPQEQRLVRARYRQTPYVSEEGKNRIAKSYDLYIDRSMIEAEFDALWTKQAELNSEQFTAVARDVLKDTLLFQRPLKPVKPGRCTLFPEEERAPLALPSQQRFRIYQEVNHLRILHDGLKDEPLALAQRDLLVQSLERNGKRSFAQIKKTLGLSGSVQFNFEDPKRQELKGNTTAAALSKKEYFGQAWFDFSATLQDEIVMQLLNEESEAALIDWLKKNTTVDEMQAEKIANAGLPEGYGSLSAKALALILPKLYEGVVTYDKAVQAAGFDHHSRLSQFGEVPGRTFDTGIQRTDPQTGEIQKLHAFKALPYYGEFLTRHVGFSDPNAKPNDLPEKRFGRISNPTVHIGLNQVRTVVNAIVKRYGHPSEVVIELARDLKQSREDRLEDQKQQAKNQARNQRLRAEAARIMGIAEAQVSRQDIEKLNLWEELSYDIADRKCPYSGVQISASMLFDGSVEIEHILPFSQTLDDSLNNKTVALREANRIKGNRSPWQAKADFEARDWAFESILQRASLMSKFKRYRFAEDGYQKWLKGGEDKDGKGFLARALNDTRYLSRVAREYLLLICPQNTRVIPGQMTAMLRGKFGLNDILGLDGEKNRNNHRHHAVDACVIGVTDQGLLQRFAQASADARTKQLNKLVTQMPDPWPTYREHVHRAVNSIWVSHKPDHGYGGAMMEATAYGLGKDGAIKQKKREDGIEREREVKNVIRISEPKQRLRHGIDNEGKPLPYIAYKGGSNYCIEIVLNEKNKWVGEVISTFKAYQIAYEHGEHRLRHPSRSQSNKPLIMRLVQDDYVRLIDDENRLRTLRLCTVNLAGQMAFADTNEANVADRSVDKKQNGVVVRKKELEYFLKNAGPLQQMKARRVTISPIGELHDPGFKG